MIDRTQEDINQDAKIADLSRRVDALTKRIDDVIEETAEHFEKHEARLNKLDPLAALLEHVHGIREFFHKEQSK